MQDATVWMSQNQLAELYQASMPTVNEHIFTIYEDHEQRVVMQYLVDVLVVA